MTIVVDSNLVLPACSVAGGFERFGSERLVAPPLMWSEARSALHRAVWLGSVPRDVGRRTLERLERCPVEMEAHPGLGEEAWDVADSLGWAKTYDAEYLALARLLGCPLATFDRRLTRGAGRLGVATVPARL